MCTLPLIGLGTLVHFVDPMTFDLDALLLTLMLWHICMAPPVSRVLQLQSLDLVCTVGLSMGSRRALAMFCRIVAIDLGASNEARVFRFGM